MDFQEAHFLGILDMHSTHFGRTVKFDTITLNQNRPQFDKKCKIRINDASFHWLEVHWRDIEDHIEAANPSDYGALIKNYTELGWFGDADECFLAYKNSLLESFELKIFSIYLSVVKRPIRNIIPKEIKSNLNKNNKYRKYIKIFNKEEKRFIHALSFWLSGQAFSFFLYGHGVKLKWPIFTSILVLFISAGIYYAGGQTGGSITEAIKLSSKIFISTIPPLGTLTGFCDLWSIFERFLGAIY